jgi:hypothetical protein
MLVNGDAGCSPAVSGECCVLRTQILRTGTAQQSPAAGAEFLKIEGDLLVTAACAVV